MFNSSVNKEILSELVKLNSSIDILIKNVKKIPGVPKSVGRPKKKKKSIKSKPKKNSTSK